MDQPPAYSQNQFVSFYRYVQDLNDLSFVNRLGQSHNGRDHYLYRAIMDLQKATIAVADETDWLGPAAASNGNQHGYARSSFDGSRTGGRDGRPRTPNISTDGLRPPFRSPTPPRTPSSDAGSHRNSDQGLLAKLATYDKKFPQMQAELSDIKYKYQDAKEALKDSKSQLIKLQDLLDQQAENIATYRNAIESVRQEAVKLHQNRQDYLKAASHLDKLSKLKLAEANEAEELGDIRSSRLADLKSIEYEQQKGNLLLRDDLCVEAESAFRDVLRRREDLLGNDHLTRYEESEEAQLSLCLALRQSKEDVKLLEAEDIYNRHSSLSRLVTQDEPRRIWALKNALGLAATLFERQAYPKALRQLQELWEVRSYVPKALAGDFAKQIQSMLRLLEKRGDRLNAIDALKIICCSDPREVPSAIVPCYIKLGRLLHEDAQNKKDIEQAITYLQDAWSLKTILDLDEQKDTIWQIALAQAALDNWDAVKAELDTLDRYCEIDAAPSADMIDALRARMQLNAGEFSSAETTATRVHRIYGTTNVLHPTVRMHQADTLIKAASKQRSKEAFARAKKVWDDIVIAAEKNELTEGEIRLFVQTGKSFADEWEKERRRHSNNLTSPGKIRDDVKRMERGLEQRR
jgi:hypothetical protein